MSTPPTALTPARPKKSWLRRWLRRFGFFVLFLILLVLGVTLYYRMIGGKRLAAATASADQLDPGWHWDDLAAQRATVPDDENAAPVVLEAAKLLPETWPPKRTVPPAVIGDKVVSVTIVGDKSIVEQIREIEPVEQLDPELLKTVREELNKVEPALHVAHRLASFSTGHFPDLSFEDYHFGQKLDSCLQSGKVGRLLYLEAVLRAQEGKALAALEASRCILVAGRSIGDEPSALAHLVHNACHTYAVQGIERTLAQGQATDEDLAATQQLLPDEQAGKSLLMALRGERAYQDQVMTWLDNDDRERLLAAVQDNHLAKTSQEHPWLIGVCHWFMVGWFKENHAVMLELSNEAVEIAKLPLEEQPSRFHQLELKTRHMHFNEGWPPYRYAFGCLALPASIKVAESHARTQTELRCAVAAVAAERFRLANGRWPESLDEMAPRFLTAVPLDPFDGKPLKLRRSDDGILIYSVGPDGVDDGGKIERNAYSGKKGLDMGFRLWNVPSRRQAPRPPVDVEVNGVGAGEEKKRHE